MKHVWIATVVGMGLATSAHAAIIVNEFDYDNLGTDSAEFVELYNPDTTPQDLTGLSLVFFNGATTANTAYLTKALTGSIPAGGYYTIGNISSPTLVLTPSSDAIQNGAPDAFGIYSGTAPTSATATNLVAGTGITYEGTNTGIPVGFLVVGAGAADGDSNTIQEDFQRIPNGTGAFILSGTLTPNAVNVFTTPTVPEPASLAVLGLGALILRRRRD